MTNIPILEGYGCRLRPVCLEDAMFIVQLRNQPFAQGNIHATSVSVEKQKQWIAAWRIRNDDYYWIIEDVKNSYAPIGTIGFYDVEKELCEGMPGRWVMMPQTSVNIMAPFILLYRFVFEELNIIRVVMDVVATNKKVQKFHKLYGANQIRSPARYATAEEEVGAPLAWFEFTRTQWPVMKKYWQPILEVF